MLSIMTGKLYMRERPPTIVDFGKRILIVLGLLYVVAFLVYIEGGLVDSQTGEHPGFWDCLYFTVVTVTTVGYGDIVPVGTVSRLTDAFLITPVRFIVIFLIFDTALRFIFRRLREDYRMRKATEQLNGHTIVCGCGMTGRAAIRELLLQGTPPEQIVVLDTEEESLEEASALGVVCIAGDAAREQVLESVAIERAAHIIVSPGRDDSAVLITLTVCALSPDAHVIAMCQENENAKLLERSGAHHIVSPAHAGGTLMAAATRRGHLVDTLEDLLSAGGTLLLDEREVSSTEVGKRPAELIDTQIIRVYRGDTHYATPNAPALKSGDILVFLRAN